MIAKPDNTRVQVIVRMDPDAKERITQAAHRAGQSVSTYMTRAALALAAQPASTTGLPQAAEDATAALMALGLPQRDAEAKVKHALTQNPQGTADELVALAFRREP